MIQAIFISKTRDGAPEFPEAVSVVVFQGVETCEPCELFRKRTHPDVIRWFHGRGGLRASVVSGGRIGIGNKLFIEEDKSR